MEFKRLTQKELEPKLIKFQEIIEQDENMPKNINKIFLLRFLKYFNGNIEKALKRLKANFQLRKDYPNMLLNRDSLSTRFRNIIQGIDIVMFRKLTSDNHRIILTKLIDFNPDNVLPEDVLYFSSILADVKLTFPENSETGMLADGDILLYDLSGITPSHVTKLGFTSLRGFFRYMAEAYPMRIKEIHVLNCSSLLDKIMMITKPFIGSYASKIMHFHSPDSTTLFDFIPREFLPEELGGIDESYKISKKYWIEKIEEHREFISNDNLWTIKDAEKSTDLTEEDSFAYMGFC